jgi:hypothetical protein
LRQKKIPLTEQLTKRFTLVLGITQIAQHQITFLREILPGEDAQGLAITPAGLLQIEELVVVGSYAVQVSQMGLGCGVLDRKRIERVDQQCRFRTDNGTA